MSASDKYDRLAGGFSEREYADPLGYSARRARTILDLGPPLAAGASVLDLCCADGIMASSLIAHGLRYTGVDFSPNMIEAARRRNPGVTFVEARMEDYEPPEPVDVTICLRSFYLADDQLGFFRRVAGYTTVKFVFDLWRIAHPPAPVLDDLRAAGFAHVELRSFFVPQRRSAPRAALPLLAALERTGPLAALLSRRFGPTFCCAYT
ncbi:MAG TPA: class I SAM-dependent methyltransferase [Gaiellaceae bacterium]|nr:class I SAM-dependent methyltransferase [Gaiellaceae bacterium]